MPPSSASLSKRGDDLRITVTDNGRGFRTEMVIAGFGLESMRQRAALIGAQLTVNSRAAGWHARRAVVPLSTPGRPMEPMSLRCVMLVDDHALVRSAIRQALEAPDMRGRRRGGSAEEAIALAPRCGPTCSCSTSTCRGMSGIEAVRELAPRLPETRIVMLTVSTDRRDLIDAMRHGASGYLTKDLTGEALLRAVRGIQRGDLPMSRAHAAARGRAPAAAAARGSAEDGAIAALLSSRGARGPAPACRWHDGPRDRGRASRSHRGRSRATSAACCASSAFGIGRRRRSGTARLIVDRALAPAECSPDPTEEAASANRA